MRTLQVELPAFFVHAFFKGKNLMGFFFAIFHGQRPSFIHIGLFGWTLIRLQNQGEK